MGKDTHTHPTASYYYSYFSPAAAPTTSTAAAATGADASSSTFASAPPLNKSDTPQPTQLQQSQPPPPSYDAPFEQSTIPSFNPHTAIEAIHVPDADIEGDDQTPLLENDPENDFSGRPPPPDYSVYQAKYETRKDGSGVLSRDPHLNADGEALVQFLRQHNTPPTIKVRFYGYHEETHWRTRNTRDENGNWQEEREPVTQRVDDFCFRIEVPVSTTCLAMTSDKPEAVSVRDLCDHYVHMNHPLKELRLTKSVAWDYAALTQALTRAIRTQYFHSVEIQYEPSNHIISVKTRSWLSRLVDNKVARFLSFICCLWILFWPIVFFCRKRTELRSQWAMAVSEKTWYDQHIQAIMDQVRQGRMASLNTVPFIL